MDKGASRLFHHHINLRPTMSVPELLLGSLNPATRQQAEKQLGEAAKQPGFVPHLLSIVLDKGQKNEVRMAAAVYFKNAARRRWADEEEPIADGDKATLREQLVPAMLALSTSAADRTERLARPQLADALAAIAAEDYPDRWPTLIQQLTSSLSEADFNVNVGVLEAAHAVCAPWKSQVRSDALFSTINSVVAVLGEPLLAMFRHVTGVLLGPGAASLTQDQHTVLAQTLHLLLCLYADLVDQDIPVSTVCLHKEGANSRTARIRRFCSRVFRKVWKRGPVFEHSGVVPGRAQGRCESLALPIDASNALQPEESTPTPVMKCHQVIFEIAELFVLKYNELFAERMPAFVQVVWELIGRMGPEVREDGVSVASLDCFCYSPHSRSLPNPSASSRSPSNPACTPRSSPNQPRSKASLPVSFSPPCPCASTKSNNLKTTRSSISVGTFHCRVLLAEMSADEEPRQIC